MHFWRDDVRPSWRFDWLVWWPNRKHETWGSDFLQTAQKQRSTAGLLLHSSSCIVLFLLVNSHFSPTGPSFLIERSILLSSSITRPTAPSEWRGWIVYEEEEEKEEKRWVRRAGGQWLVKRAERGRVFEAPEAVMQQKVWVFWGKHKNKSSVLKTLTFNHTTVSF